MKPVRLTGLPKHKLNLTVIERDDETCQNPFCRHGWPLDIPHHVKFKSRGGGDVEDNLITLCVHCHRMIHNSGRLKCSGVYPDVIFEEV